MAYAETVWAPGNSAGGGTFRDEAEARAYDEHGDDLDIDTAVAMFCKYLSDRKIDSTPPTDPFKDQEWSALLTETYLLQAFL